MMSVVLWLFFFFFKQKTAYEMRISDWSSDVCSSDLDRGLVGGMTGEIVENLAAQAIAGADANRLEPVEHVELGQRDAGDARHGAALAHQHQIGRASCRERVCKYV